MGSQALCKVKVHYAKGPQHISMEIKKQQVVQAPTKAIL